MLEISHISKTFNPGTINEKKALIDVSFTLNDGDFCTVIGGNGAGKSTIMNAVSGVWPVDTGSIKIDGIDVTTLPEHKRAKYLGRVFQEWGVSRAERERYREELAKLDLGLENRLTAKVGLLSGGQRQALTLLMATLQKPHLLLLDEHTAALDPKTAAKVLAATDRIVNEGHLTTLMVTHNMRDAIAHGNRLIMMSNGQIIYDVQGEEKKKLHVEDLLHKFEEAGGEVSDRMALS